MDMATDLRVRMAEKQLDVAEVAKIVGRGRITVSRWRTGRNSVPLELAITLRDHGLLSAESIREHYGLAALDGDAA